MNLKINDQLGESLKNLSKELNLPLEETIATLLNTYLKLIELTQTLKPREQNLISILEKIREYNIIIEVITEARTQELYCNIPEKDNIILNYIKELNYQKKQLLKIVSDNGDSIDLTSEEKYNKPEYEKFNPEMDREYLEVMLWNPLKLNNLKDREKKAWSKFTNR